MLKLPNLKVLRVFNWPHAQGKLFSGVDGNEPDPVISSLNSTAYHKAMEGFVRDDLAQVFDRYYRGRTSPVLCFHGVGKTVVGNDDHGLFIQESSCWVPARQFDVFGRIQTVLQLIDEAEVKYFEPECEILTWD